VLWRVTGKPMYREWAWSMFQSFDRECRCAARLNRAASLGSTSVGVL
jgi:hypothetical protein